MIELFSMYLMGKALFKPLLNVGHRVVDSDYAAKMRRVLATIASDQLLRLQIKIVEQD